MKYVVDVVETCVRQYVIEVESFDEVLEFVPPWGGIGDFKRYKSTEVVNWNRLDD